METMPILALCLVVIVLLIVALAVVLRRKPVKPPREDPLAEWSIQPAAPEPAPEPEPAPAPEPRQAEPPVELPEEEYRPIYENFVEGSFAQLLALAIGGVAKEQAATVSVIENALGAKNVYSQAAKYLDYLLEAGIVVENTYGSRTVAITEGQALRIIIPQMLLYPSKWGVSEVVEQLRKDVAFMLADFWSAVDVLSGTEFEAWCADLLRKLGYEDVALTRASGDQGVDILAVKDDVRYAFQCKCYASDVGNTPVQEVYAGLRFYSRNVGVVITNRYFTQGAKDLAKATDVLLWDRDKLRKLIQTAGLVNENK